MIFSDYKDIQNHIIGKEKKSLSSILIAEI